MLRRDYIQRAIEQLGASLARIAGLRTAHATAEALAEIQTAKAGVPLVPGVLELLSAQQVRSSLGDDRIVLQLAELYTLEAELLQEQGNTRQALRCARRALDLRDACTGVERPAALQRP